MTATKSSATSPTPSHSKNVFRIHGVNVLNRKNVDSIARLTALERRRATHILDERQRRDTMNQLLTELATLVRESATDLKSLDHPSSSTDKASALATESSLPSEEPSQQQQQPSSPPPTLPTTTTTTTATTVTTPASSLNPDGTERRPPVKSNSITTLRSAIAEIHRLRTYAGLQTIITAQSSSEASSSPLSRAPSSSRSSSPPSDLCSLSTLAALACQQSSTGSGVRSHEVSPQPTPQRRKAKAKSTNTKSNKIKRDASSMDEADEDMSMSMRMIDVRRNGTTTTVNQLYSPPLSPSSPTVSHPHHFSSTSSSSSSSFTVTPPAQQQYYHHHFQYHHQQQQYQQVIALTPPSTTSLPSLYSMVSPMDSESSSSTGAPTGCHFGGATPSNRY